MALIVSRTKSHEFRKVRYPPTLRRIWFYETAPISAIRYICDVGSPVVRPPKHNLPPASSSAPSRGRRNFLPEDGSTGNSDYNAYHPDYAGYDYAYPILSCTKLAVPVDLARMKDTFGIKGAPRGMVFVPDAMREAVELQEQEKVW